MPFYDLKCKTCEQESNVRATIAEKTELRIACPKCGSTDMVTAFNTAPSYIKVTGDPVSLCANSKTCSAACVHARGA